MIFKKGNKKFLAGILGIVFLVFGFWLTQAPKAEAISCSSGCDTKSSGECVWDWGQAANNFLQGRKTCAVGASYYDVWDLYDGWETSCNSDGGTKKCETGKCPSSTVNGATCTIIEPSGSITTGGCLKNEITGKWDANEGKCIQCSSSKENQIYGDTASLTAKSGDNQFESACGADTACDEQVAGFACALGKNCDANGKCVAAAVCTRNAPTVSLSPSSKTGAPGSTQTYTVSITNNNTIACSAETFTLTGTVPGGWSGVFSPSNTITLINLGSSGTRNFDVTSAAAAAPGSYPVSVTATGNTSGKSGSGSATYIVSSCPAGFSVSFGGTKIFSKTDNFLITYNSNGNFCVSIDRITGGLRNFWAEDTLKGVTSRTNYNTGVAGGGYVSTGNTVRATINNALACNTNSLCRHEIQIVECTKNSDCTSPATCNLSTYTCVAAATQVCNSTNCSAAINNAPCQCGTLTTVAADMGKYCCAGNSLVYGSPSLCQVGACAAGGGGTPSIPNGCYDGSLPGNLVVQYSGFQSGPPGDSLALLNPNNTQTDCKPISNSAGNVTFTNRLTGVGTWTVKGYEEPNCTGLTTLKASGTVTVQSTPCAGGVPGGLINPLKCKDFVCLIEQIVKFISYLAVPIVILMIVIAAFLFMTAGGDAQKISSAKNVITYTLIGLLVIILARALVAALKYALGA